MPVLESGRQRIDYLDEGSGPAVLLIHSASSSYRQWLPLIDGLRAHYRVLAINLFGYGQTTPWPDDTPQQMTDQAALVLALMDEISGPVSLIGHSLGGVVALEAALLRREQVASLAVYEPNPFHLLRDGNGPRSAYDSMVALMDDVEALYRQGLNEQAAQRFMVFWSDQASWDAMPPERRARFAATIGATVSEGRALQNNHTPLRDYANLALPTLLMYARDTLPAIYQVQKVLAQSCPRWQVQELETGGHMAPMTQAESVNKSLRAFVNAHAK